MTNPEDPSGSFIVGADGGIIVAGDWDAYGPRGEQENNANAILATAAPELLAALQQFVAAVRGKNGSINIRYDTLMPALTAAESAIAKATATATAQNGTASSSSDPCGEARDDANER